MPRRKVVVPFGVQRGPRAGCLWFGAAGTKKEEEDEEGREGLRWRGAKAMMRENYWNKNNRNACELQSGSQGAHGWGQVSEPGWMERLCPAHLRLRLHQRDAVVGGLGLAAARSREVQPGRVPRAQDHVQNHPRRHEGQHALEDGDAPAERLEQQPQEPVREQPAREQPPPRPRPLLAPLVLQPGQGRVLAGALARAPAEGGGRVGVRHAEQGRERVLDAVDEGQRQGQRKGGPGRADAVRQPGEADEGGGCELQRPELPVAVGLPVRHRQGQLRGRQQRGQAHGDAVDSGQV
mmetsp:Transcript_16674/g.44429  ORF Transcript_16674/g.44429 Transcript_16674/m.44429 type:complete len:293 (-) Transcript_16674:771-1649(-)